MTNEHDNDKNTTHDDLKHQLAALAAGDLDSDAAKALQARIINDKDLAAEADQLKQTADLLRNAFAEETDAENAATLTDAQRQAVLDQANRAEKPAKPHRLRLWLLRTAAAAAMLAIGIGIGTTLDTGSENQQLTQVTTEEENAREKLLQAEEELRALKKATLQLQSVVIDATEEPTPTKPNMLTVHTEIAGKDGKITERIHLYDGIGQDKLGWSDKYTQREIQNGDLELNLSYAAGNRQTGRFLAMGNLPMRGTTVSGIEMQLRKRLGPAEQQPDGGWNREAYEHIAENPFLAVGENPLSTFSIDVDTASYTNVRRMLQDGQLPPAGAVRIEEMVNYFDYGYQPPAENADHPFAVHLAAAQCPWQPEHRLVRVALKGKEIQPEKRPPSNLVFLLDVSGSMSDANKLPLVRRSMQMLVDQLGENDRVAIAVYAGAAGMVLDSTPCHRKEQILAAIENLSAGGSTNGGAGIRLAYKLAEENFIKGGANRVILCTDGDFNVGTTSDSELVDLITDKAKSGVFLTVLGFGMGNYQDTRLEQLADKGNGTYGYIDTDREAERLFVKQLSGTLVTIAKDVKIQVEFNPAEVAAYRLIGYENRMLAKEDFNDDTKDAGEIGAGHAVTALYEIVPAGEILPKQTAPSDVDPLKYQRPAKLTDAAETSGEMLTVKLRYKQPDGEKSVLLQEALPAVQADGELAAADADFRWAAAVASFGMQLRGSQYAGQYTVAAVEEMARSAVGEDPDGQRAEFLTLVGQARELVQAASEATQPEPVTPEPPVEGPAD